MTLAAAYLISDAHEGIGRIGRIPVRNLWLLMLYASDLFRDFEKAKVAIEDNPMTSQIWSQKCFAVASSAVFSAT